MNNNFYFNNANMPNMYPVQRERVTVPVQQQQQQEQYPYQYQHQAQFYQQPQYFQQPQCQQHQYQRQQFPQLFPQQCPRQVPQQYFPQYQQQYPQQYMQHPQQDAQQYYRQLVYNQQLQYLQQPQAHQQLQQYQPLPQHLQYPQYHQQPQQQYQHSHVQHQHIPDQNAMLPIQQEPESFVELLGQDLPFPVEQQPNRLPLVGASQDAPIEIKDEDDGLAGDAQDAPIEIDDEVEVLTQKTASTPESQKGQPPTPRTQAASCSPVREKPKNSWYTQLYGQKDSNGNMRRRSVEDMARDRNVRVSALKSLTKEDCVKRMFEEDVVKATRIAKQTKAKELGLANPQEDEEDEKEEEDKELVMVRNLMEKESRPAALKRKSVEADIEDNSISEPVSKRIRTGTEQEQISAPVTFAAAPVVLAPEKEDMLAEELEALLEDEETAGQHADLEIEMASSSNCSQATSILPSIEPATKVGRAARLHAPRQRPNKQATKKVAKRATKRTKDTSAALDTSGGPSTKEAEEEVRESPEVYNTRVAAELEVAMEESDGEEAEESREAYNAWMAAELEAAFDGIDEEVEESTEADNRPTAAELEAALDNEDEEETEEGRQEAYNAQLAAVMEAEMDEDEDELVQRARSASVSSDEDEDDDYIGNKKYGR